MSRKFFLITILFAGLTVNVQAQSAEDSVKAVVNRMFEAMKNADGNTLLNCFSDSAVLQTISRTKDGKTIVRSEEVAEFAGFVNNQEKGIADERIVFETIRIDADLALVWTPYRFYYKGNFSHCGVNSFHLVRFNGQWKIQYLIDTRRKSPCN